MRQYKKAEVDTAFCVGCGVCMNECPLQAIHIKDGICAVIDKKKCVGCGKCEKVCPASIISIVVGGSDEN